MGQRYYMPSTGRWTHRDPKEHLNPANPPEGMPWNYVGNNPCNYIDPTGTQVDYLEACTIGAIGSNSDGRRGRCDRSTRWTGYLRWVRDHPRRRGSWRLRGQRRVRVPDRTSGGGLRPTVITKRRVSTFFVGLFVLTVLIYTGVALLPLNADARLVVAPFVVGLAGIVLSTVVFRRPDDTDRH